MKKFAIFGLVTATMLTGCSNDELITINQNNSDIISFETFVNKTSRATDITNDNIGDFGNGFSVYGYTKGSDESDWGVLFDDEHVKGSQNSWTYDRIQYWKKDNEYHFHAIAPFGDAAAQDIATSKRHWSHTISESNKAETTIHFDNIVKDGDTYTAEGLQDLVYGYKRATGLAQNNSTVGFTLSHLLSRVKFRIIGADNNPSSVKISLTDATITNTYSKGDITISNTTEASSKASLANTPWTVDENDKTSLSFGAGLKSITNDKTETNHKYIIPDIENSVSYSAVLSFELEAGVNNGNTSQIYTAVKNVDLPNVKMLKGHSYVYEIKINVTGNANTNNLIEPIVFNVVDVDDWDEWITPKYGNVTNTEEVQLYDYAMSDGSFVHLEEGESLTSEQKAACIGIIFWLSQNQNEGHSLSDDGALMQDYPNCTHGLIVSLKYLTGEGGKVDEYGINRYKWFGTGYNDLNLDVDIWDTFQKEHSIYGKSPYTSIQCNFEDEDLSEEYYEEAEKRLNLTLGYNNTQVLLAYNNTSPEYPVEMITALQSDLKAGRLINYEGYSSWYIPSATELWILGGGDTDEISTEVMDNVNVALQKLDESSYDLIEYYPHWSSTECSQKTTISVWLYQEKESHFVTFGYKFFEYPIRPICAF